MPDTDVETNVETVIIVEIDDVLFDCVWARATDPEVTDKRRARKAMITRMRMLTLLSKPTTFTPDWQ
jgi:hypothetical protein